MADPTFGARAAHALATRGPLCVGIDPHASTLLDWGLTDDVTGLERFSRTLVEALAERVAFLKPQSAFFERFGAKGIAVLETVIAEARAGGAQVILDAKRGDIGSTMEGYASAYLDPASPLCADAVTATPFLGFGSLRPMLAAAEANRLGVIVVTLTSNKEGAEVQGAVRADGRTVAQALIDDIAQVNAGAEPLGSVGIVVGATIGVVRESTETNSGVLAQRDLAHDLMNINGPVLVPGMGAQGGTPADLKRVLGSAAGVAIPSYSREIARRGPSPAGLREAADQALEQCRAALNA